MTEVVARHVAGMWVPSVAAAVEAVLGKAPVEVVSKKAGASASNFFHTTSSWL